MKPWREGVSRDSWFPVKEMVVWDYYFSHYTLPNTEIKMQGWYVPDWCVPERKFLDVAPLELSVPCLCLFKGGLRVYYDDLSRPWTASSMKLAPSASGTEWISGASGRLRLRTWPGLLNCTLSPHIELYRLEVRCRFAQSNMNLGMGWFGKGQNSQGTLCPRDATSKNFRLGTYRSGTD
jgi:hypothetical protein